MGGKIVPNNDHEQQQAPTTSDNQQSQVEKLESVVTWVLAGGPADKVGIKVGDQIIEWDGKCLLYMSYEQVAEVIESSANIAELLIKPAHKLPTSGPGLQHQYIRSQRRLSHQTERDLRRSSQTSAQQVINSDPMYQSHNCHQQTQNSNNLNNPILQVRRASDRSGTGRMLPQIPAQAPDQNPMQLNPTLFSAHRHSMCSSTGELESRPQFAFVQEQKQQQNGLGGQLNPVNPNNYQSRSTGQLHYQNEHLQQQHANMANGQNYNHDSNINSERLLAGSPNKEEILALIGLQVNVDERQSRLQISVLSAININLNMNQNYYVRIGILPERLVRNKSTFA